MTANVILEQFVRQKQLAGNPSQTYQNSFKLDNLLKALKELFFRIQDQARSLPNLRDKGFKLVKYFEDLNLFHTTGIKQLRKAIKNNLSKALNKLDKMEVAHA